MGLKRYYTQKKLEVDKEIFEYKQSLMKEVEDLAMRCAKDKGHYEHDYHHTMEKLGIEIAKLEARKSELQNDEVTYKEWLKLKDDEIARLNGIVSQLIEKIPTDTKITNNRN